MHVGFISKIGATELVLILLVALLVFDRPNCLRSAAPSARVSGS